jgi:hypothetical protein
MTVIPEQDISVMVTILVVSLPAAVFTGTNLWMGRPFIKVLSCRAEFPSSIPLDR